MQLKRFFTILVILVLVASCKQKETDKVLHGNKTLQEPYL